jgi:sulfoxide reductase heme-binding subunit YedZ
LPLALLIWDGLHNQLTVNPIQAISQRTGKIALVLLVLSLVCTPLNTLFGLKQLLPLRRPLGLYAFGYTLLHLLNFTVIDYGLDLALLGAAILEKRYVLVGWVAFLLLVPLALTSTVGAQRRLGKRWKVLHRLVYGAAPLAVVHFAWLVKADVREPLLYGACVALLLVLRVPPVRHWVVRLRRPHPATSGHSSSVEVSAPSSLPSTSDRSSARSRKS